MFWKDTCQVLNQVMATLISPPFEPTHIFDHLWLGTIWTAKQLVVINPGIGMVLNCTDETIFQNRDRTVHFAQLGLLDREPIPANKLGYAIQILHQYFQQRTGRAALVCCHASRSRSPAIVLAYLVGCGMGFKEAHQLIRALHPLVDIHPEVLLSVATYFGSKL